MTVPGGVARGGGGGVLHCTLPGIKSRVFEHGAGTLTAVPLHPPTAQETGAHTHKGNQHLQIHKLHHAPIGIVRQHPQLLTQIHNLLHQLLALLRGKQLMTRANVSPQQRQRNKPSLHVPPPLSSDKLGPQKNTVRTGVFIGHAVRYLNPVPN